MVNEEVKVWDLIKCIFCNYTGRAWMKPKIGGDFIPICPRCEKFDGLVKIKEEDFDDNR